MAYRWTGFALPRSSSRRALIAAFVTLAVVVGACSEGEERIDIGGGQTDAGSSPTTGFQPTSDGGDAGKNVVEASVPKGPMCVATECPYPFETCTTGNTVGFTCGTNLLADRNNCGTCGNVCPNVNAFPELNMETQCVDGTCARQCVSKGTSQFQDCNGQVDDGCETNVTSNPNNCGGCGVVCPPGSDGVARCIGGQCGCPDGKVWCDPTGCTDIGTDDLNCGACGNECQGTDAGEPPPHMEYKCQKGKCAQLKCEKGWDDCNGIIPNNGCEVDIVHDNANCGACGNVCPAGQKCLVRGQAIGCGCEPLETLCTDTQGNETCADLLNDVRNCGACGYSCPNKGSGYTTSCQKGYCEYECAPGTGDCDGDVRNGCETNLLINGRHCGACGNQCDTAAGQPCVSGSCLMTECDAGPITK